MVKKTKIANDPGHPLKRQKPTENAGTSASTSSIPSKKSGSSKLTPTRSSMRKSRSNAKVAAIEDSSDSDCTPPPSIISRSSELMKRRIPEKRTSRKSSNEKAIVKETEVIDLTDPHIKSSRKRPKVDIRLSVDLDSFINLCSDEELNSQPRKKRKVVPAEDVIFISSGDETELPGGHFVQQALHLLEHVAETCVSNEEYFAGHSAANADPLASQTSDGMEMHHNNPDASTPNPTPPPASPLENDNPESATVDIAARQNMTGIEGILTPRLSQELLSTLYQESLQNSSAKSSTSEETGSTSFRNAPVSEHKHQFRRIVYTDKLAKPALLTPLFFARAMRSRGTSRPKDATPQSLNSLKTVALIESCVEETNTLGQGDTEPLNFQNIVLDASTIPPHSHTDSLRIADTGSLNVVQFLDTTTHEGTHVASASPLMEVGEIEVDPVYSIQPKASEHSVPPSCLAESSAKDVPSMETAVEENDTSASREEQADDRFEHSTVYAEVDFTKAEAMEDSEKQMVPSSVVDIILQHCNSTSTLPTAQPLVHTDTHHETSSTSAAQGDEPLTLPAFLDTHHPCRGGSSHELTVDNLSPNTSHILQTYLNPSIFELEHSRNLTFQILFTSDRILDDDAISLPCYPERMCY